MRNCLRVTFKRKDSKTRCALSFKIYHNQPKQLERIVEGVDVDIIKRDVSGVGRDEQEPTSRITNDNTLYINVIPASEVMESYFCITIKYPQYLSVKIPTGSDAFNMELVENSIHYGVASDF